MVGFEEDDVVSVANVHLVSFLGLFSLDKMPDKHANFVATHKIEHGRKPNSSDLLQKNRANFTIFLKQRMEDLVRVCRQKARNIKGLPTEEYFFYYGPKKPPANLKDLAGSHEKYGYRKLDTAVYKSIRKQIRIDDASVFKFNGNYYVAVMVDQKVLSVTGFVGAGMDPYDSIHNMTPEQTFFNTEDTKIWEKREETFKKIAKPFKVAIIKEFIEKNSKNPKFKGEVETAIKVLRRYGVVTCSI
jgi:hypothetical protein